jgi:hypothetical protein
VTTTTYSTTTMTTTLPACPPDSPVPWVEQDAIPDLSALDECPLDGMW